MSCAPSNFVNENSRRSGGKSGSGVGFISASSSWRNFETGVGVAPKEGDTREPVFRVDQPADAGKLLRRQDADGGREFRAGDSSADGAGSNLGFRVVADAFVLSQFAARHEVEFVIVFGKPDGRVHRNAALPESGEAYVSLAVDFAGDDRHGDIVNSDRAFSDPASRRATLSGTMMSRGLYNLFKAGQERSGRKKSK